MECGNPQSPPRGEAAKAARPVLALAGASEASLAFGRDSWASREWECFREDLREGTGMSLFLTVPSLVVARSSVFIAARRIF